MATAPNPLMLALMQRLAAQGQGQPSGMPGAMAPGNPQGGPQPSPQLEAARAIAATPYGKEKNDLKQMQVMVGTLVPRFLQRDPKISTHLVNMYKTLDQVLEAIDELPAMPVLAPPTSLPTMGGPAMASSGAMSPMG